MKLNEWLNHDLPQITNRLVDINQQNVFNQNTVGFAGKEAVYRIIRELKNALFPGVYEEDTIDASRVNIHIGNKLREAAVDLASIIEKAMLFYCNELDCESCDCKDKANQITIELLESLPVIRELLQTDIVAAYNGDPAAKSHEEIIISYPSIEALSVYRIAHFLYSRKVPVIPRIMSEFAHEKTGIDINPGAVIGSSFFIDHGTGVVIGETCVIGNNVKLYQGVTLGAKSFTVDDCGNLIKNVKRHPDIEDNVVIYAGATILGGKTVVGHDSVIGGNVWLTNSVKPFSRVYNSQPSPTIKAVKACENQETDQKDDMGEFVI